MRIGPVFLSAMFLVPTGEAHASSGCSLGTDGPDEIYCSGADDSHDGDDGSDLIVGRAGDDLLRGGTGHDRIYGDGGMDVLAGDEGNDYLHGGPRADSLAGWNGDDILDGSTGADGLSGGEGWDQLTGGPDDDELDGGGGIDRLVGGDGDDLLSGELGEDLMEMGARIGSSAGADPTRSMGGPVPITCAPAAGSTWCCRAPGTISSTRQTGMPTESAAVPASIELSPMRPIASQIAAKRCSEPTSKARR